MRRNFKTEKKTTNAISAGYARYEKQKAFGNDFNAINKAILVFLFENNFKMSEKHDEVVR